MITGHLGMAAVVRSRWPDASLAWLLVASVAPDVLDILYVLVGFCSPFGLYSHTVPAVALIAVVLTGVTYAATRSGTTALAAGALVLLHLPADMITGHKYLWPGLPRVGLDLYRHPMLDFALEIPIALCGWWLLRRASRAPRWATLGVAAGGLLLVQAVFDAKVIAKPSACRMEPGVTASFRSGAHA